MIVEQIISIRTRLKDEELSKMERLLLMNELVRIYAEIFEKYGLDVLY